MDSCVRQLSVDLPPRLFYGPSPKYYEWKDQFRKQFNRFSPQTPCGMSLHCTPNRRTTWSQREDVLFTRQEMGAGSELGKKGAPTENCAMINVPCVCTDQIVFVHRPHSDCGLCSHLSRNIPPLFLLLLFSLTDKHPWLISLAPDDVLRMETYAFRRRVCFYSDARGFCVWAPLCWRPLLQEGAVLWSYPQLSEKCFVVGTTLVGRQKCCRPNKQLSVIKKCILLQYNLILKINLCAIKENLSRRTSWWHFWK